MKAKNLHKLFIATILFSQLFQNSSINVPANKTLQRLPWRLKRSSNNGIGPFIDCYNCNIYVGNGSFEIVPKGSNLLNTSSLGQPPNYEEDDRILGGRYARVGELPSIVSLQYDDGPSESVHSWGHSCGGSIITSNLILTAAHCFGTGPGKYRDGTRWRAVAGVTSLNSLRAQIFRGASVCIHDRYNPNNHLAGYDVAVLKLASPIDLDMDRTRVREARIRYTATGTKLTTGRASGWGLVIPPGENPNPHPTYLRTVLLNYVTERTCRAGRDDLVEAPWGSILCAGSENGRRGECSGDSGGPISCVDGGNTFDVCGVAGAAPNCTKPARPRRVIYTNVAFVEPWLRGVIAGSSRRCRPLVEQY